MALSKQTQPRLNNDVWYKAEVEYCLQEDVVLDARERLVIRETNVPVIMFARHLAKVGWLELYNCTLSLRGGGGQALPHPRLWRLDLERVCGVSDLLGASIQLSNVNWLWLSNCPGVRLSDLTARTFPTLGILSLLKLSGMELGGQLPPTVRELGLSSCGRVEWGQRQPEGCQVQRLVVLGSTLVLADREGQATPWNSLQELELSGTQVVTTAGLKLYEADSGNFSRVRGWLTTRCPNAEIEINNQPKQAMMNQQLLDTEMQQVYKDACLKGTTKVFRGRLLLVGHMGAGKSSVKRRLLHQKFIRQHLSTDGIETEDQTFVVDVTTAVDWKVETQSQKEIWTVDVSSQLLESMSIDGSEQTPSGSSASKGVSSSSGQVEGGAYGGVVQSPTTDVALEPTAPKPLSTSLIDKLRPEVVERTVKERMKLRKLALKLARKGVFTIWDFGGQEVYYTSHQTFLSRRAIYLLVMDITNSLDDVIESQEHEMFEGTGKPRTARDFLEFWMKSVHTHLIQRGSQESQMLSPPVIIVCTKKDLLPKSKTARNKQIEEFMASVRDHLKETPYYQHVHDVIAISNCTYGDPEVEILRKVIFQVATKQPYWGEERPTRWLLLADMFLQEAAVRSEEPVMSLEEVTEMAEVTGVSGNEVPAFLNYHHNLGDLIYFDEVGMNDTIILSPQWLANMFSKVITQHHKTGMKHLTQQHQDMLKKGMLSKEVAAKLPDVKRPETLTRIMERFDMLIPREVVTDDDRTEQLYLVPCLLQRVPQDCIEERDSQIPSIHFKFIPTTELDEEQLHTKGFLPPGLFHRHISSCCREKSWRHFKDLLFYDYIVFGARGFSFSLHMTRNGITLSVFKFKDNPLNYALHLTELREEIQRLLEQILDQVFPNLSCVTFLLCEGSQTWGSLPKLPGLIQVPSRENFVTMVVCPCHRKSVDLMPWSVWFGMDSSVVDITQLNPGARQLYLTLEPHLSILLSSLSYKVRDRLVDAKLLSLDDNKAIEAEPTVYAENTRMYQTLLSQVEDDDVSSVKESVCDGLCMSSQCCPFAKEPQQAATPAQRDELRKLRPRLIEGMEVPTVLDWLEQESVLDDYLCEKVKSCQTRRHQVHALLAVISCMNSRAHEVFLDVLRKTNWWIFE